MSETKKQKENLQKIADYLKKAKIIFKWTEIPSEEGESMPALLTSYSYKGYKFDVLILSVATWVMVQCYILDTKPIEEEIVPKLYELCLELNFNLPETTFSLYNGQIFVEADMPVTVSYNDFLNVEMKSIGAGIDAFLDELGIENVKVEDTKGKIKIE